MSRRTSLYMCPFQALGRVLTIFLQSAGHTCGIEDLTLTARAETQRRDIIEKVRNTIVLFTVASGPGMNVGVDSLSR